MALQNHLYLARQRPTPFVNSRQNSGKEKEKGRTSEKSRTYMRKREEREERKRGEKERREEEEEEKGGREGEGKRKTERERAVHPRVQTANPGIDLSPIVACDVMADPLS